MNRTQALCLILGWQGGTVHQVSQAIGVSVLDIIYGTPTSTQLASDYCGGWFAARTCTLEHLRANVFAQQRGNKDFWLGAAEGKIAQSEGR
jgi:hypothetical protein